MQYLHSFLLIIYLCFLSVACNSDNKVIEENDIIDGTIKGEVQELLDSMDNILDTFQIGDKIHPEGPPISTEGDSIRRSAQENSSLKVDCCKEEGQDAINCCCKTVVEEYGGYVRQSYATEDEELKEKVSDMKTNDPYLGDCMKIAKWRAMVDAIENP